MYSKPLGTEDKSGTKFVMELLNGDPTYGINFDRIQWSTKDNRYIIVELLFCEEKQFERGITPYSSHPNRYFHLNKMKFISLWKIARDLNAILYLVNYSNKESEHGDEILLMTVVNIDEENKQTPVITVNKQFTRKEFSRWFRDLNKLGIH
jgi:hypothetical protein